ncbi:MAG: CBS domain-containing protein [Ignavibacteriales bacterium]
MKVKELMSTPVTTVSPRNSIKEALEIMQSKGIRRAPVLEDGLVGMVVQRDIERALRSPGVICETPVEWVMTKSKLHTISPDDTVVEAARILIDQKISALPVIEDEELIGIITDTDILNLFIKMSEKEDGAN